MTAMSIAEMHPEPQRFMTVREVASALQVSRATVYRLIHSGGLPGMWVGRSVRVSRRVVQEFLRQADPGAAL